MKIFKFMIVALVAMCGFASCNDCDHDFIDVDHSSDLVGTWTCLEAGYAEALVIKADGSALSTGVENGEYWENVAGNIVVKNGKVTMTFEVGDNFEGHIDVIPGMAFSIHNEEGERLTYNYCANDLADEIVGMWVCNDAPNDVDNDMLITTYKKDGSLTLTGIIPNTEGYMMNVNSTYKVVGDLRFTKNAVQGSSDNPKYISTRLIYLPNGTSLGDIMVYKHYNGTVETTASNLRIHQDLDLAGKSYDYNNLYLSNVKGKDQDINFWGYTMNLATMDGSGLDKMLKGILFHIEFPDANTISYTYNMGGNKETFSAPIVVEGNKLTVKMSQKVPTLKDIEYYAYQDADDCQMHLYMHRDAFVNFYTNMQAMLMAGTAQFDITNADAIDAIYNNISDVVETINLSIIMK